MQNVVRAWSPPPAKPRHTSKKSRDKARKGALSASVVWRSNPSLGAYRNKSLLANHDAKMKSRLHNVKSTISTSLAPAVSRKIRKRGKKKRKTRVVSRSLHRSRSTGSRSVGTQDSHDTLSDDRSVDGSKKLSLAEAIAVLKSHSVTAVNDDGTTGDVGSSLLESGEDDDLIDAEIEAALAAQKRKDAARREAKRVEKARRKAARAQQRSVARLAAVKPKEINTATVSTSRSTSAASRRRPTAANLGVLSPAARRAASSAAKRVNSPRAQRTLGAAISQANKNRKANAKPAQDPTKVYSRRAPQLSTFVGESKSRSKALQHPTASKARTSSTTTRTTTTTTKAPTRTVSTGRKLGQRVVRAKKMSILERMVELRPFCRRLQVNC